jgi:very-short-patch-repair endonuclease
MSTNLERHGVSHPSQVEGASEKMLATRFERFGTAAPIHHNEEIASKWRKTMVDRHGADHPLRASAPKAKRRLTVQERFGQDPLAMPENRLHLSEAGQKGYRTTAKRTGSWITSTPENLLVEWLRARFGIENVEHQVAVNHGGRKPWLIDAYVKTLDVYVELDGEFWHGLDKPYDQLHPKGKKAYDRDREQDRWFLSQGMRLVRITDKEFLASQSSGDYAGIVSKLGG